MSKFPRILPHQNTQTDKNHNPTDSDHHYSWIRRLESHIQSLSSRLAAIEKRLSIQTDDHPLPAALSNKQPSIAKHIDESTKQTLNDLQIQLQDITSQIAALKKQTAHNQNKKHEELSRLQKREPPILHIGAVELPIEISGLLGGILSFILAGLVLLGQAPLITSPAFLILVGFVFLLSTLLKIWNPRQHKTPKDNPQQSNI